jgi:hypothetical protein
MQLLPVRWEEGFIGRLSAILRSAMKTQTQLSKGKVA